MMQKLPEQVLQGCGKSIADDADFVAANTADVTGVWGNVICKKLLDFSLRLNFMGNSRAQGCELLGGLAAKQNRGRAHGARSFSEKVYVSTDECLDEFSQK